MRRIAVAAAFALSSSVAHAEQPAPATPPPDAPAPPPAPDTTSGPSPLVVDALPPAPALPPALSGTPAPPAAEPDEEGIRETRFAVGAGGHLAFGTAPATAVGVQVSAELATRRWSLGLEGRYDLPASAETTHGATARTSLAGAQMLPCLRAKSMFLCAVVLLSHVEAQAAASGQAAVADGFFFLGLGGRLAFHAGLPLGFALRAGAEALVHPVPYELSKNGSVLFKTSAVSTTLGLALVHVF